ncbi:hypothetical protein HK102_004136, partial [Quaeritorhiza haematococci]
GDLYQTLTDPGRVHVWTRGPAKVPAEAGKEYELFGGNVSGTVVEMVPNKKIVQKWRLKSWPKDHHSTVTLEFDEQSDSTFLRLTQTEVPIGEKDTTESNWHAYYWNPIKSTFGYGAVF